MSDKKAYLLLNLVVFSVLIFLFRSVLWHPNSFLFASTFDGIKNYYTFIYYILYDKGIHFSGMNYPFGEHVVYTDNQPLFSLVLGFIHRNVLDISGHLVGIFNYIIILSLWAGCIVVYIILRKCLLPPVYSIIIAILIVLFAQQNNMFNFYFGAYALSYTWVIPLQWLLIIKIFERVKVFKWVIIYAVVNFFIAFIHPYYLLFGFLLLITQALVYQVLYARLNKVNVKFTGLALVAAGLPLLFFKVFLVLTDQVTDRPETPWGMAEFRGNLAELFFPAETVFSNYWKVIFNLEDSKYDGYGYIGVVGIICLFLSLIKGISYLFRAKFRLIIKPVLPLPLRLAIWPAVAIMLFAMGFPFRLHLEELYRFFPFVKQFRVLARFLWVFYYVFAVYTAFYFYQLYRYLRFRNAAKFAYSLLFLILLSWALDAALNIGDNIKYIRENRIATYFTGKKNNINSILAAKGFNQNNFQAILPFPYFTAGSEKIFFQPVDAMPAAMATSIQTGLPLINGMMSRTSLTQSLAGIQLMSNDYIEKELLQILPNNKPLLLVVVNDSLQYYEKSLLRKASFITQQDTVKFYQLPVSAFAATAKEYALNRFEKEKSNLYRQDNIYTDQPRNDFFYSTFSDKISQKYLFQRGALTADTGPVIIYNDKIPGALQPVQEYSFSVWLNLESKAPLSQLTYEQFDKEQKLVDAKHVNLLEAVDIYQKWVNVKLNFKLLHPDNTIKFSIEGKDIVVDELLIKPADLEVYIVTPENKVLFNNYLISP